MMKSKMYRRLAMATGAALIASTAVVSAAAVSAAATGSAKSTTLKGTFKITAGANHTGKPTGTYFRMLEPGQKLNGPDTSYFTNPSSTASDKTYTYLRPGTAGGLKTGVFQSAPSPAFDAQGMRWPARSSSPRVLPGSTSRSRPRTLTPRPRRPSRPRASPTPPAN